MAQLVTGVPLTDVGPLGQVGCPSSLLLALGEDFGLLVLLPLDLGLLLLLQFFLRLLQPILGRVGRGG